MVMPRVHRHDLVIKASKAALVLGDEYRFETAISVPGPDRDTGFKLDIGG
jgi:hypothetical protein